MDTGILSRVSRIGKRVGQQKVVRLGVEALGDRRRLRRHLRPGSTMMLPRACRQFHIKTRYWRALAAFGLRKEDIKKGGPVAPTGRGSSHTQSSAFVVALGFRSQCQQDSASLEPLPPTHGMASTGTPDQLIVFVGAISQTDQMLNRRSSTWIPRASRSLTAHSHRPPTSFLDIVALSVLLFHLHKKINRAVFRLRFPRHRP